MRRISRAITIRIFHRSIFESNTLQVDFVGVEEVDDGICDLYFCFYQMGRYPLQTSRIQDIVSRVPVRQSLADKGSKGLPMS